MRFYTKQHRHYCGIDLHARSMCLCILDQAGEVLLHKNFRVNPEAFLKAVANYREDPVVAVRRCAPPATCSADASTSRGNAPSCSLTSRMPTASTICRYSRRSSPTHPTGARPRDVTVPGIGKILSLRTHPLSHIRMQGLRVEIRLPAALDQLLSFRPQWHGAF